jgi:hypothetical protein
MGSCSRLEPSLSTRYRSLKEKLGVSEKQRTHKKKNYDIEGDHNDRHGMWMVIQTNAGLEA